MVTHFFLIKRGRRVIKLYNHDEISCCLARFSEVTSEQAQKGEKDGIANMTELQIASLLYEMEKAHFFQTIVCFFVVLLHSPFKM